jgi:hypothetical protein
MESTGTIKADSTLFVYPVSPCFYLKYVFDELLKQYGFYITTENYFSLKIGEYTIQDYFVLYNNYDITTTYFQTLAGAEYMYWGKYGDSTDPMGFGYKISHIKRMAVSNRNFRISNHIPRIKLADFLLGIQNLLNIVFVFRSNKTIEIVRREDILLGESFDLDKYFVGEWSLGEKRQSSLKFLMEHDGNDGIFSERYTDLSDRLKDLGEPVEGWSDLAAISVATVGEIRYLTGQGVYCEYKWLTKTETDPDTKEDVETQYLGWEEISIKLQPGWINYGEEEVEEIKTLFSTVFSPPGVLGMDFTGHVSQKGNSDDKRNTFNNFSPRIIYDLGGANALISSLEWDKAEQGILDRRYKYWGPFWANRLPVEGSFHLPLNVLYYVVNNIYGKFRTRHGEFIIESMEAEFKGDIVGKTYVTGYKVE